MSKPALKEVSNGRCSSSFRHSYWRQTRGLATFSQGNQEHMVVEEILEGELGL